MTSVGLKQTVYMYFVNVCKIYSSLYFQITVHCLPLIGPNNGIISCSLKNQGAPFNGDTCSFTCNAGYELTGSDTRTCQSDTRWSGSETICLRGKWCNGTYICEASGQSFDSKSLVFMIKSIKGLSQYNSLITSTEINSK